MKPDRLIKTVKSFLTKVVLMKDFLYKKFMTGMLLLLTMILFVMQVSGQTALLGKKITVTFDHISLKKAFEVLEQKADVSFAFNVLFPFWRKKYPDNTITKLYNTSSMIF